MDKKEILEVYDRLIKHCLDLHEITASKNLGYEDIRKKMKSATEDKSIRMYETLDMDALSKSLHNAFSAVKRNVLDVHSDYKKLSELKGTYGWKSERVLEKADTICKMEDYDGMYTPVLTSLASVIDGSSQFVMEAKRLEYFAEQSLRELDKMNMLRNSMREIVMKDLSYGTLSDVQNTDLSQYKEIVAVMEEMQKNDENVNILEGIKESAVQQTKEFSQFFTRAVECKKRVRETSYTKIREDKMQEMNVQKNKIEYDGPTLE